MESQVYEGTPPALETVIGGGYLESEYTEDLNKKVDELVEKMGGFRKILGGGNSGGDMSIFGIQGGNKGASRGSEFDINSAVE